METYRQLLEWKNNPRHKPLILNGARQVGKTWLLKHFGEKEYKNVAYVNCDKSVQMKTVFDEGYDIPRIIRNISAMTNVDIRPHETLIILDELQSIPKGLPALKYFCEDAPEYDVAVAGSLLGIQLHRGIDFVVQHEGVVTPIEVKAEENLRAKSLRQIVTSNTSLHGLRFSMSNCRHEDWLDNVPLYGVATRFTGKNECFI